MQVRRALRAALAPGDLVSQELPVDGAAVGWPPTELDRVGTDVVGGRDGGLPARHLPQGHHVVAGLARNGQADLVDRRHAEGIHCEGLQACHVVGRAGALGVNLQ